MFSTIGCRLRCRYDTVWRSTGRCPAGLKCVDPGAAHPWLAAAGRQQNQNPQQTRRQPGRQGESAAADASGVPIRGICLCGLGLLSASSGQDYRQEALTSTLCAALAEDPRRMGKKPDIPAWFNDERFRAELLPSDPCAAIVTCASNNKYVRRSPRMSDQNCCLFLNQAGIRTWRSNGRHVLWFFL